MNFVEVIARKRDGHELTGDELRAFVEAATNGSAGDEQLAALLMAICIRGASPVETRTMTEAMRDSGERWDLAKSWPEVVDKHSTGGVGDSVSLVFAPLLAACGLPVAMMAGAGLGHTQGTLDKLDAIPGFVAAGGREGALARLDACGVSIAAQSDAIAPADRKLYALRDITGTVPSLPLIVASIMSKKLAVGAGRLVLDVKVGSGAFCKDRRSGEALAGALVEVARGNGVSVTALLTDMDEPLGDRLGCASEVRAAIDVLEGRGSGRLRECTIALAEEALILAGRSRGAARSELEKALNDGRARTAYDAMVRAHGGDPDPRLLPRARRTVTVTASRDGYVAGVDGEILGGVAVSLGAGRRRHGDEVDHAAGVEVHVGIGHRVETGAPLATLEVGERSVDLDALKSRTMAAFTLSTAWAKDQPLVIARLGEGS